MNITDTLSVLENADSESISNVIVDVFDVVLESWPVFPPHAPSQLKPQLLLKVGALLRYTDRFYQFVYSANLGPSLELFHGNYFH